MYRKAYQANKKSEWLKSLFQKKLDQWDTKEHCSLVTKLMEWSAVATSLRESTVWDIIEEQIRFKARKANVSPQEVIESLFNQKNAEAWMIAFQVKGIRI